MPTENAGPTCGAPWLGSAGECRSGTGGQAAVVGHGLPWNTWLACQVWLVGRQHQLPHPWVPAPPHGRDLGGLGLLQHQTDGFAQLVVE